MAAKRSCTRLTDYVQLNNFSSAVLYDVAPQRKKGKIYQVERIISRKKEKHDFLYLIKWAGWPLESSTWEPSVNLPNDLLRGFERPPKPTITQLEHATRAFVNGILSMLKSKAVATGHIEVDLDIWRYIVQGKGVPCEHRGYILYNKDDFNRIPMLPSDWWYYLTEHGDGRQIDFPLKAKPVLLWSPKKHTLNNSSDLVQAPRYPIEKINISFARKPCNQENIVI